MIQIFVGLNWTEPRGVHAKSFIVLTIASDLRNKSTAKYRFCPYPTFLETNDVLPLPDDEAIVH